MSGPVINAAPCSRSGGVRATRVSPSKRSFFYWHLLRNTRIGIIVHGSRKNIEFVLRNYWKFSLSKIEKVKRTEYSWGGKMVASLVLLPFQLPTRSNSFEARKYSITIKTRLPSSYHAEYGNEIARKSRISRTRYRNAWRWILIRA